jgi:hypothetical protein
VVQKAAFRTQEIVPLECIVSTEKRLLRTRGVRKAALDGQTNEILVTYNSPEATLDAIRGVLEVCGFLLVETTEARNEYVHQPTW